MVKKALVIIIAIITAVSTISCSHSNNSATTLAFIQRSYWVDRDPLLTLTFYHTGKSFANSESEIERCSIGNGSNIEFDCKVSYFNMSEGPIYTIGHTKYYMGKITINTNGLNASIGNAVITITNKNGQKESFSIGNIVYTETDEKENIKAQDYIEYALIHTAFYFENERPRTPTWAIEISALKDITITSFSNASDNFGFDNQNCEVFSYDEYMNTLIEPLEDMELDKLIPDIYDRRVVARKEAACEIELKKGISYVLVPLVQYEDSVPELIYSGIDIHFSADGKNYITHVNCNPLFVENFHPQDEVTELFDK